MLLLKDQNMSLYTILSGFESDSMKFILPIVILSLVITTTIVVSAQMVEVNVIEILRGKISAISYNSTVDKVFKATIEFYNTGSAGYKTRIRMDVFNESLNESLESNLLESGLVYRGWSKEISMVPGVRKNFHIYWYPYNVSGNFTAKLRAYYGGEISEFREIQLEVKDVPTPADVFEIKRFRAYDDYVKFDLKIKGSSTDSIAEPVTEPITNVIILPSDYPMGWIFEQTKIDRMGRNDVKLVVLPYEPSLWEPTNITINVVTEDGKYFTSRSFALEKEAGALKYIHYITDSIMNFFKI